MPVGGGSGEPVVGLSPAAHRATEHHADHLHEAPVWVVPVLRDAAGSTNPLLGASIYGAVQQLQLAARVHGIGSTLMLFRSGHEAEVRALLGLPDDALTTALIPLGYPVRGRWSRPTRQPVDDIVHGDRWDARRSWQP